MTLSLTYEGLNYPAFANGAYAAANSLSGVVATGANAVSVGVDYGINAETSTVYADATATDSLTDLSNTILQAESLGLQVMVRPLTDLVNESVDGTLTGTWRDTYEPYDPAAFFASYETMIVNVASVAQADGAAILDIGSELDQLTGPQYLIEWTQIISAVRAVYSGKLTYSADWNDDVSPWINGPSPGSYTAAPVGTGNVATQISFWNQLDYAGIDEYAPISDAANPTVQQLIDGWTAAPTDPGTAAATGGQSLISFYENISADIGKPLLFTEIGYQDATDAAEDVVSAQSTIVDQALQSSLYTAFFDAWEKSGDTSLTGTFFWYWNPDTADEGAANGITFSPQDLEAQTALTTAYSSPATDATVACYLAGTHLETPDGERRVEDIRPGDLVLTGSGEVRPIVWMGERDYRCGAGGPDENIWPVLICAGALEDGVPRRDLLVSPDHALLLDGLLIPARYLVNGVSIRQLPVEGRVTYYHLELETHDILLAEGAPAESYLDTGNRAGFTKGLARVASTPGAAKDWRAACAELIVDGPRLVTVKQRLFARGARPVAIQQTLQVAAGPREHCRPLCPDNQNRNRWSYSIPPGERSIHLLSAPFVPARCIAHSLDQRYLGVRLAAVSINGDDAPLDVSVYQDGFYPVEITGEGPCRWTNGSARLALPAETQKLVLHLVDPVIVRP